MFEELAVGVKATRHVSARDLRALRALREEGLFTRYVLVSMEPRPRLVEGVRILPWTEFLDRLWRRDW